MKNTTVSTTDKIVVKPFTTSDLANIYGVDRKTIRAWIKRFESEVGPKYGRYFTIRQVTIILDKLGIPYTKEVA